MNEKQEIFVREYLKDFNGTRAYKEAYKSCKKDDTARTNASRLLANANIQRAIQEQSSKRLEEIDIDVAYIVNNIKEVTERCMKQDEQGRFDAKNSLRGLELLGKYKAIFSDNVNLNDNTKSTSLLESINKQLSDE